ncbi:MAG: hypothetical protein J5855_00910 [Mailhella sp.]|nr:hypothetical protein [Mailhella sp.]
MNSRGINYNDLPLWQKRGVGVYFKNIIRKGVNPRTGEEQNSERRELVTDMELPMHDAYAAMLDAMMESDEMPSA